MTSGLSFAFCASILPRVSRSIIGSTPGLSTARIGLSFSPRLSFARTAATATATTRTEPAFVLVPEHPPRKQWPPDFSRLTVQQQLRFERKHKRRVYLATRRPRWNKGIKLLQTAIFVAMIGWAVMSYDLPTKDEVSTDKQRARPDSSAFAKA